MMRGMSVKTKVSNRMVISAVWELHRGGWPTSDEIAAYLKVPADDVLSCLRDLKALRIFKDRRRKGRQVWGPWSDEEFNER